MSVLVSKRTESRIIYFHNAFAIRREFTKVLLNNFYFDKDKDKNKELDYSWFIQNERSAICNYLRNLIFNIELAEKISNPPNLEKLKEKEKYQDQAIAICIHLKQELQWTIETLSLDVNKYIRFVDLLDDEIRYLKNWKKTNKRFLKNIG